MTRTKPDAPEPVAEIRFLVLEFLVVERCRNDSSHYLPYYVALARDAGAATSWLAYGCDYSMAKWGYYVDLSDDDLATLRREVKSFKPTHILSTEYLSPRTSRVLEEEAPQALYLSTRRFADAGSVPVLLGDGPEDPAPLPSEGQGLVSMWKMQALDADNLPFPWLVPQLPPLRPGEPAVCMTDLRSDYDARIMNKLGRRLRGFVRIIGGHHCTSTVPLKGNPLLKGIDLRRYPSPYGCTYCSVTGLGSRNVVFPRDPVDTALRQLKRVIESVGVHGRNSSEYDIYNTQVFLQLERFFDELLAMDFPAGAFHFSPRLDDFLSMWPELNRTMPRLVQAGHRINILRMGIENFSPAEQRRFNKGISLSKAIEAIYKVKDLKQRYPKNFFVSGFGFILFSPWTTLDDLQINLTVARLIGYPVCGHMLTATTQMDENVPMLYAARRDGLVTDEPDDPAFVYDTWRTRSYRPNQAWMRFRDPIVSVLFRTLARVVAHMDRGVLGDYFAKDDVLFQEAVRFHTGLPKRESDYLDVAEILVEAARTLDPGASGSDLVRAAEALAASPAWQRRIRVGRPYWWTDPSTDEVMQTPNASPYIDSATDPDEEEGPHATAPEGPALTAGGLRLKQSLPKMLKVAMRVEALANPLLPGWTLVGFSDGFDATGYGVTCVWRAADGEIPIRISPGDQDDGPAMYRSPQLKMTHAGSVSLPEDKVRALRKLCHVLDQCLVPLD